MVKTSFFVAKIRVIFRKEIVEFQQKTPEFFVKKMFIDECVRNEKHK